MCSLAMACESSTMRMSSNYSQAFNVRRMVTIGLVVLIKTQGSGVGR